MIDYCGIAEYYRFLRHGQALALIFVAVGSARVSRSLKCRGHICCGVHPV